MNTGLYASHVTAAVMGVLGAGVGGWVAWTILHGRRTRPTVAWLLGVMVVLSGGSAIEQMRLLFQRMSLDGTSPDWMEWLLDSTWQMAAAGRVASAAALGAGVMLQLALYCNRTSSEVNKFAIAGALTAPAIWILLKAMGDAL